jgi:hypothetical protein
LVACSDEEIGNRLDRLCYRRDVKKLCACDTDGAGVSEFVTAVGDSRNLLIDLIFNFLTAGKCQQRKSDRTYVKVGKGSGTGDVIL